MSHKVSNADLIIILKENLAAMEVKNANRFSLRAYQNVIASIESLNTSVYSLWQENRLSEIPGVGGTIKQHFNELFTTGEVQEFIKIKEDLPDGMFSLIGLRSVGARRAFKLATAFNLKDRGTAVEELKKHIEKAEVQELDGFGEKSEADLLEAISQTKLTKNEKKRTLLFLAEQTAEELRKYLLEPDYVEKVEVLGSYRRREETVGDLDIAIATTDTKATIKHFLDYPEVDDVLAEGDSRASVTLKNDLQVDIRVVDAKAWGSMVQYFTGNKYHNVLLRTYALEKGLSLSEYGIKAAGVLKEFASEQDFYEYVGVDYIEPEMRQGKNEVELAKVHKLPVLIKHTDIKGDIHTHTNFSDGVNTLEEVVEYAKKEMRYEYIGVADHAPSVTSRGYDEVVKIITDTKSKISDLNSKGKIKVLYGYEVNILKDATLAMPDELLKELDYVLAGVHTSYNQDRDGMTKRLIMAAEHPLVTAIVHPSGRIINEREAYDVDWTKFLDAVAANNKILEINAQPNRLDLPADLVQLALQKGIKIIINTDAHELSQIKHMRYGVDVARRGFCEAKDVANTFGFKEFKSLL